jgi:flagellar hook-associated protein 1
MSLFSSIQLANNTLQVSQIGLQVTGNNLANASTEGYLRQQMVLTPGPPQRKGDILLGLGVRIEGIRQQVDKFLETRFQNANSDLAGSEAREYAYMQLESILGELGDADLQQTMSEFFGAVHEVLNEPESRTIRNLVNMQAGQLTSLINRMHDRSSKLRNDMNDRIAGMGEEINRLLTEIGRLNVQIASMEGGGVRNSDAVGLRDRRQLALSQLSEMLDIRAVEQDSGTVTVFVQGEFLVVDGNVRPVSIGHTMKDGLPTAEIRLAATDSALRPGSGRLAGLLSARDDILGDFLQQLDDFARDIIFEFNKVYSQGQGLKGHRQWTSQYGVDNPQQSLADAGLPFQPINGSFEVQVRQPGSELSETTRISVKLNGQSDDTTLESLAAALNDVDGLQASVTLEGRLRLETTSPDVEFAFADDSSHLLAALGVNTYFDGTDARSFRVNEHVLKSPELFAASRGGIGEDTKNVELLADLLEAPLESKGGDSLSVLRSRLVGSVTQGSAIARSVAEGFRVFQMTLEGERLSVSGVNIDEEVVRMISYQRMYQASARYISTISDIMDMLVSL